MRVIGLIGGMSWESSAEYYRILNQGVRNRQGLTARMVDAAHRLEAAGADMLLVHPEDSPVPIFDTTALHAQAPVAMALA